MSEITDDEFKKFMSENKDRVIQYMKTQGIELADMAVRKVRQDVGKVTEKVSEAEDNIKEKVDVHTETAKSSAKEFVDALMSTEVQRHLIRSGMEFMMALGSIFDAIPKPEVVSKACDKAADFKSNISKEHCANNQDCPRKEVKKIEID